MENRDRGSIKIGRIVNCNKNIINNKNIITNKINKSILNNGNNLIKIIE